MHFLRVCTYTLTPLSSMTTCGVIQIHQVRIFRESNVSIHTLPSQTYSVSVWHTYSPLSSYSSILPHEHLWDGLLPTTGATGKSVHKGLTIHSTILNILRECVTPCFLLLPSPTPVGWPTSYQVDTVRIPRGLATYTTIINILCASEKQFFLFPPSQTPIRWAM